MKTVYDEVHYFSRPYEVTHPARMQSLAAVFDHQSPAVPTARVLELGCGSGGNLLPLADAFPEMEVVGVDLAESAVEMGQAAANALGLDNVTLLHMDLAELPADVGRFDYIIAHGVYSWVPSPVRERVLEIYRDHLTDDGVGYISYNCLPGWHLRGLLRDLLLWTTHEVEPASEKIQAARDILRFVADGSAEDAVHRPIFQEEVAFLDEQQDFYLFHDHMAPHNEALYLTDFIARLRERQLDYLGDCYLPGMIGLGQDVSVQQTLSRISRDLIEYEQYLDYVRNRPFRRSLVIREGIQLSRHIDWTCLSELLFSHDMRPAEPREGQLPDEEHWKSVYTHEPAFVTSHPLVKAAMQAIHERPQGIPFPDLVAESRRRVGGAPSEDDAEALGSRMLQCWLQGSLVATRIEWDYMAEVSERPRVASLTRYFAAHGDESVTNRKHRSVNIDKLDRRMIELLDGTRTVDELMARLVKDTEEGLLSLSMADGRPLAGAEIREAFGIEVPRRLDVFARASLLVG